MQQRVIVLDTAHGFVYGFIPSVPDPPIVQRRMGRREVETDGHIYVLATHMDSIRGLDRNTPVLVTERCRRGDVPVDIRYVCSMFRDVRDHFDA
jgi:hypothetical protein